MVTLKIVDDGTGEKINDLSWVNERRITRITPRDKAPLGLPQRVENLYLDFTAKKEMLLGAEEFEYDREGHPVEKGSHDANNCHLYSLFWEYDAHGNILLEKNALGEITQRKYDANDNLTEEYGPTKRFHLKNEYDYSNRLTKQEEIHDNGQVFTTQYEYNYTHQCTKQIDLFGQETLYEYDDFGRLTRTHYPAVANEKGEFALSLNLARV